MAAELQKKLFGAKDRLCALALKIDESIASNSKDVLYVTELRGMSGTLLMLSNMLDANADILSHYVKSNSCDPQFFSSIDELIVLAENAIEAVGNELL